MTVTGPRLLVPPAMLGRSVGLAVLHWGVIDGPHGLSLVIEVVDEEHTGSLNEGQWKDPSVDVVQIYATTGTSEPIHPKVIARTSGPSWQRWTVTFGRYDRPARVDLDQARIVVNARPISLEARIDLAPEG
ncbi:hypothetical protein AB0D32_26870 [Micromonospora sp. NPDC048170]|uniref:hypothetical protein n=1 Tax=Micromonospora sp. NPDC048170 TaxID=3154819 RepID=UPI0033D36F50